MNYLDSGQVKQLIFPDLLQVAQELSHYIQVLY
jgi:hypothetical protein